ncbi:1555_t:CDS:2 [Paraglomus occultum]|uniref:Acireductone dioxygenase n=1 Tax=Paraglomus occultum TaxID=144539 RepID=A0A9N9EW92_9GLOM|nr:1555_t:CDS:2 [Paraglomus occultum]
MRAYYHDGDSATDQRLPHEHIPYSAVAPEELSRLGVLYWRIEKQGNWQEQIDAVAQERSYKNRDVIKVSKEAMGDVYESKLRTFYEEHLHEDEEIRYILDGSGYFDVRDEQDRWIRIAVTTGDLLVLPAGIYHRFTLDANDYIEAMRLFKDEPKWTPINRPADANPFRLSYLQSVRSAV